MVGEIKNSVKFLSLYKVYEPLANFLTSENIVVYNICISHISYTNVLSDIYYEVMIRSL